MSKSQLSAVLSTVPASYTLLASVISVCRDCLRLDRTIGAGTVTGFNSNGRDDRR